MRSILYNFFKIKGSAIKQVLVILLCLIPIFLYLFLPINKQKTILILGDSLSSPYGIGPQDSWVVALQQRLDKQGYPYKVVNSSTPGDRTDAGLARLPQELTDHKPTLTIIELGANDAIQGLPIATIRNNLLKLIRLTKQANSKVLLLGMHMFPNNTVQYAHQFAMIYPDLAKQEQVYLIPVFLIGVETNPALMQADKLHPTKEAQPLLLETVWPEIKKILDQDQPRPPRNTKN